MFMLIMIKWAIKSVFLMVLLLPLHLFVVNYIQLFTSCNWPKAASQSSYLNAMILADPHLLGYRKGSKIDQYIRESEMSASFRVAKFLFKPDLIIFLGDLLDEGLTAGQKEFSEYVERFSLIFPIDDSDKRIIVPGNHDIGFHDHASQFEPFLRSRFEKAFNATIANTFTVKGIQFVTVNSMALEGDRCPMCMKAERSLETLAKTFRKDSNNRPILLQHYPLYRRNDANCKEIDSYFGEDRETTIYSDGIHCISQEATNKLINLFNPRLSFDGHIHHGCVTQHGNTTEYTVASFNWRNLPTPNFLLLQLSKDKHFITKCFMPRETVIFITYFLLCTIFIYLFAKRPSTKIKSE